MAALSDIPTLLRAIAGIEDQHDSLLYAAADEIDRLRRQVRDLDQALSDAELRLAQRKDPS